MLCTACHSTHTVTTTSVKGFTNYFCTDPFGKHYIASVPDSYVQKKSRSRDEYYFESKDGETLSIAFASTSSDGLLSLTKSNIDSTAPSHIHHLPSGATIASNYHQTRLKGQLLWIVFGLWLNGKATGSVQIKSPKPVEGIKAQTLAITSSIVYDQSINDVSQVFGPIKLPN